MPLGSRQPSATLEGLFPSFAVRICGSGTQALALALADARSRSRSASPQVILPAYGCPDLVTASVHAGVFPRLIDTAAGEWGYDLAALEAAISPDTVAIVAVNFLGIGDQALRLRQIATERDTLLIQDSAQHLPSLPAAWSGDYVVLSFGRGKPLNLLGGGALLYAAERDALVTSRMAAPEEGLRARLLQGHLGALAFNVATHPRVYGLSARALGGSLGSTRYKTLDAIRAVSANRVARVVSGLAHYNSAPGYDTSVWSDAVRAWASRGIEPLHCNTQRTKGAIALRLPLLARDERLREAVVTALDERGLGASRMYGRSLEQIADVPAEVAAQGPFPNAADLARRLFTLPTHTSVNAGAVRLARQTVNDIPEAS